jgi:hypothetical protein
MASEPGMKEKGFRFQGKRRNCTIVPRRVCRKLPHRPRSDVARSAPLPRATGFDTVATR